MKPTQASSFSFKKEPLKLMRWQSIKHTMDCDKLIWRAEKTGIHLKSLLGTLEKLSQVRGMGTYISYDLPNEKLAQKFQNQMLKHGIITPVRGSTVFVRPALVFDIKHANLYLDRVDRTLQVI
mmetsp:Transcript_13221/g.19305  ORF Transcript_13221/g.19305 Transcript_13221/m.19305 type:complete len:123 (+) Transcript_13221:344-712(+)